MPTKLHTFPELEAEKAQSLAAFDGLNLVGLKRKIEILLSHIGREKLFDEYTAHDISHIDAMLALVAWLVPKDTRLTMTPADWLLLVLAVYFHDLGMLVTRDEFNSRAQSGFAEYRDNVLFADDSGVDYKARVEQLSDDAADRFLYQEFVRHTHATRIKNWITGNPTIQYGCSHQAISEVTELLAGLDSHFRRDLALVCESHHLDDLNDLQKYKVSQPYGNSDAETANVHYAAIVLRTADLLHITQDRTPSLAFRLINPADPISQLEWAKQHAVKRIRPQLGKNKEGAPDPDARQDTIEVFAHFTKPEGFFGLTSYLLYAGKQLQKSFDWAAHARKSTGASHDFPWRFLNDEQVETSGFLPSSFRFTLDQAKILDLLTGHTLYNQTNVVLRELAQNSLDAIRLRLHLAPDGQFSSAKGEVRIRWSRVDRRLSIVDNGTGMTQRVIENHLLKVGSSQYQDKEFIRKHPQFSSISRFGIGVLSTFMVSDSVEIVTCHPEDDQARLLNLRSVHGKYLIKLLDKESDSVPELIRRHGTSVTLRIRPSASLGDILEAARKWMVIPKCNVTVQVDDETPTPIGYDSPKDALAALVAASDGLTMMTDEDIKVRAEDPDRGARVRIQQFETPSATVAVLLQWQQYFGNWTFVTSHRLGESDQLGICVEGIRVEEGPPGYTDKHGVAAIVNAHGPNAPKTNVARSGLEHTSELQDLLRAIYGVYCEHISSEFTAMQERRAYSLTWAAQEARWSANALFYSGVASKDALTDAVESLPLILAERDGTRLSLSVREFQREQSFWTVDGQFFRSAELLIREAASTASLNDLISALRMDSMKLPTGLITFDSAVAQRPFSAAFDGKEVDQVRIDRTHRRVDLRWSAQALKPRWAAFNPQLAQLRIVQHYRNNVGRISRYFPVVCTGDIDVEGRTDEAAVRFRDRVFFFPNTRPAQFLLKLVGATENLEISASLFAAWSWHMISRLLTGGSFRNTTVDHVLNDYKGVALSFDAPLAPRDLQDAFIALAQEDSLWQVFDASHWNREREE